MNDQIKDIGMRLMFLREEAELSEKEMAEINAYMKIL